jgi:tetratricopeptide (TPR) repeat protein
MAEHSELPVELTALLSADGDGPAARIDAAAAARIVENALAGAVAAAPQRSPQRPRMRKAGWLLAAALVLTGSAAAMYAVQRAAQPTEHAQQPAPHDMQQVPAPAATPEVAAAPAAPVEQPAKAAAPAPVTAVAPEQHATAPRVPARASGADDLLQRANRFRGDGDYRNAEHTYLRAVAANPHGLTAYTARVAAAGLRLERFGDAAGALQLYKEALRTQPAGSLTPEIHEGMAHAYRALGRAADERRALQALLSDQASGPAAERARARLQVLDAPR